MLRICADTFCMLRPEHDPWLAGHGRAPSLTTLLHAVTCARRDFLRAVT